MQSASFCRNNFTKAGLPKKIKKISKCQTPIPLPIGQDVLLGQLQNTLPWHQTRQPLPERALSAFIRSLPPQKLLVELHAMAGPETEAGLIKEISSQGC